MNAPAGAKMPGDGKEEDTRSRIDGPAKFLGIPLRSWSSVDSDRKVVLIRVGLGAILTASGFLLFGAGASRGLGGLFYMLGGMLFLVGAAACFGSVICRKTAVKVSDLLYPDKRFSRPQPLYSHCQSLLMMGRTEEAVERYLEIAKEYPEEVTPWISLIDIAFKHLNDLERARAWFHDGLAAMREEKHRRALGRLYQSHLDCYDGKAPVDGSGSARDGSAPCDEYGEIDPEEDGDVDSDGPL
jgi:hypothetical protein